MNTKVKFILAIIFILSTTAIIFLLYKNFQNNQKPEISPSKAEPSSEANHPLTIVYEGFENNNTNNWRFGRINRAVYTKNIYPGSYEGEYWLDTALCPDKSCPSDFGDEKTLAYDLNLNLIPGQRYRASIFFRSPQNGTIEFVVWTKGGEQEVFSTGNVTGSLNWKRINLDFEIKKPNHNGLRLQVYIKNDQGNFQYQFDNLILKNRPLIIGHKYLYHNIPAGTHWSGKYTTGDFQGWSDCQKCLGRGGTADPQRTLPNQPYRRDIGTGDGITYPYIGIYDDSNIDVLKWQLDTQINAGINVWDIAFWSDALPQYRPFPADNFYYPGWKTLINLLIPLMRQRDFKFYITDEMTYNWNQNYPPDTNRLIKHAVAVLTTFKNEPSYLRIADKMVYFLPQLDLYVKYNRIPELDSALQQVEKSLGQEVFWIGYVSNFYDYVKFKNTKIKAFQDGYGISDTIADKNINEKIKFFSQWSQTLQQQSMGYFISIMPGFNNENYSRTPGIKLTRKNGDRFKEAIDVFLNVNPKPIAAFVSQAEYQEGKTIEPAVKWADDTSTDPYKYLKILSQNLTGVKFRPATLPPSEKIDPLRAGNIYGRGATIVSHNLPNNLKVNQRYMVNIKIKNTGGAVWTRQTLTYNQHGWYKLDIKEQDLWRTTDPNLNSYEVIYPQQEKSFVFYITAPRTPGTYNLTLQMKQQGFTLFGQKLTKSIQVTY
ncbi:MAG: hypothetical protein KatS3mg090_0376 [Patescibacteria group bacterium]|nr:MAG: hypothetical protein KatS3mg090_0376 [Patescibacteria group bacterium]